MTELIQQADVIVIGAGIAGIGIAAQLGPKIRVVVLEREDQPGYHSTGRSAAVFSETYGGATVRLLSRGSRTFFMQPPAGFASAPLLTPRGFLFIARPDQREHLEAFAALSDMQAAATRMTGEEACARVPLLRPSYVGDALLDDGASDIDVHALLQGYASVLRRNGGTILCNAEVTSIERDADSWRVATAAGTYKAPLLVNAAGAWADEVAALACVARIGLQPMRRTAALVDMPAIDGMAHWPLTIDIDEQFYFKPDAGRLLISLADETPSPPCDAVAEELDVAIAVDRIERATTLDVRRVQNRWAGLRSFVADRSPVAGFAPDAAGFFWLAGQGGYGLQTAPALSQFAAARLLGQPVPSDLADMGLVATALSAERLQQDRAAD